MKRHNIKLLFGKRIHALTYSFCNSVMLSAQQTYRLGHMLKKKLVKTDKENGLMMIEYKE